MIKIINFSATPIGLIDQMRNKIIEVIDKKTYDSYMSSEKELADILMEKNKVELNILKEINNKDLELLDNQNLVNYLDESERLSLNVKKFEQQTKTVKNKFDQHKNTYKSQSEKVA